MAALGGDDGLSSPTSTGPVSGPVTASLHASSDRSESGYAPGRILLGKYQIVRKLGVGGMAEVYQAVHLQLGSQVALKLPLGRHTTAVGGARLLREAQVAASLDPERVVRVYDIGTLEEGTPFIVLEYLAGKTLAEALSDSGRFPVKMAAHYVFEACLGLSEAHRRGIVHRDVKPSNLFVEVRPDGSEKLKILDFGIASIRAAAAHGDEVTTLTDSSVPIGSPPYMAPEQLRGVTDIDARCDVWALGVTLYQLVSGALPFRGSATALIASIVSDPPPSLRSFDREIPADLERVVLRCLSKDAKDRYASASELAEALRPFLDPSVLVSSTDRKSAPHASSGVTIRRVGIVVAACAVVALGAVTSHLWRGDSDHAGADPSKLSGPQTSLAPARDDARTTVPLESRGEVATDPSTSATPATSAAKPTFETSAPTSAGSAAGAMSAVPNAATPTAPGPTRKASMAAAASPSAAAPNPAVPNAAPAASTPRALLDEREF